MVGDVGGVRAKPVILIVDDSVEDLSLMGTILRDEYHVKIARSGAKALKIALEYPVPDLILLDVMMSEMDGHEVCIRLKDNPVTKEIPIIFLTAKVSIEDEQRGLELGAVDYITKPASPPIVLARVKTHLHLKAAANFLKDKSLYLERIADKRTHEVQVLQEVMILSLASLAETRDNETGKHLRRTQHYVKELAVRLRNHSRFEKFLTDYNISMLFKSAPLHDVGKVGIPDGILLKPGRYEPAEFEIMKKHTIIGYEAIERAERNLEVKTDFLTIAKEIAYSHHEHWDGAGYPRGLSGEDIPISARLMALADVYDAIISRRIYKDPIPHEKAVQMIMAEKGAHFDPDVVDAFVAIQDEFKIIAEKFADDDISEMRRNKRLL